MNAEECCASVRTTAAPGKSISNSYRNSLLRYVNCIAAGRRPQIDPARVVSPFFLRYAKVVPSAPGCRNKPCVEPPRLNRSEEHTSELQSQSNLVCRLLLEK